MNTAQKLRIKEGDTIRLVSTPDDYVERLGELPTGVTFHASAGNSPTAIHLHVNSVAELAVSFPELLDELMAAQRVWIVYPRKKKYAEGDANRDSIWKYLESQKWKAVANYPVGEDLSAVWAKPTG